MRADRLLTTTTISRSEGDRLRAGLRRARIVLVALFTVAICGCGATMGSRRVLATSVSELSPHGDRDHFVFLFDMTAEGQPAGRGIQVEHVTKRESPGEFEVSHSENGVWGGSSIWRDDGRTLFLIAEDAAALNLRLAYDPPLPLFAVPLEAGEHSATSTATASRLDDGQALGSMTARILVKTTSAGRVHTRVGTLDDAVRFEVSRTLEGPDGKLEFEVDAVYAPGFGEVSSIFHLPIPVEQRRELACAIIGNKPVGDCKNLAELVN